MIKVINTKDVAMQHLIDTLKESQRLRVRLLEHGSLDLQGYQSLFNRLHVLSINNVGQLDADAMNALFF